MTDPLKTELSPGFVRRAVEGLRYTVSGIKPDTWMSPGQPIAPEEQQVQGRAWDFMPGQNLWIEPRSGELITFAKLRNLAEFCDLVRMAVETRKDQLCAMEWEIRVDEDSGRKKDDPVVEQLRTFFRRPDGRTLWSSWLRMLLEDLLVIDAPALYVRPRRDGKPYGLEVMDGATFKPILDEDGRAPLPPDPAYQQILKGIPAVDFTAEELIYLPRNPRSNRIYGYSPVEQIIVTIEIALRRQAHKLQYYTEGSTPDLLMEAPPDWTLAQIKQFRNWFNSMLSGNTADRRKAMMVPNGTKTTNTKEAALTDQYDEWLARVVMFCFSLPPTPFVKAHSRANDVTQRETAEDEGKLPLMNWVKDLCNLVITDYLKLEGVAFAWKEQKELDPSMQATVDKENVMTGTRQIDEIREERGDAPLGLKPGVVTAKGFVPFKTTDFKGAPDAAPPPQLTPGAQPAPAEVDENGDPVQKRRLVPIKRDRDAIQAIEKKVTKLMSHTLKKAAPGIADKIVETYEKHRAEKLQKDEGDRSISASDVVASVIATDIGLEDVDGLAEEISKLLGEAAKDGATAALKQVGITDEDVFDFANEQAVAFAKDRGAELVGKKWVGDELIDNPSAKWAITQSTRDALRGYVAKAVKEGWSGDELKQKIVKGFAFSPARAEMIARTEVARADTAGNLTGWKESGVVSGKEWLLSNIHPRTDICDDNASVGKISFNSPFPSGDMGPPAHPACECAVIPVIDEE